MSGHSELEERVLNAIDNFPIIDGDPKQLLSDLYSQLRADKIIMNYALVIIESASEKLKTEPPKLIVSLLSNPHGK